jgi:hypothetical protein
MTPDQLMKYIALTVIVLLPALTITIAIAARFALKPIAESILNFRKAFAAHENALLGSADIEKLDKKVADLEREVEILKSEREFDRALSSGGAKRLPPNAD